MQKNYKNGEGEKTMQDFKEGRILIHTNISWERRREKQNGV